MTESQNEKAHMRKYLGEQMPASKIVAKVRNHADVPDKNTVEV